MSLTAEQRFRKIDTNGDGAISPAELEKWLRTGHRPHALAQKDPYSGLAPT
jgi:hypothetical protein